MKRALVLAVVAGLFLCAPAMAATRGVSLKAGIRAVHQHERRNWHSGYWVGMCWRVRRAVRCNVTIDLVLTFQGTDYPLYMRWTDDARRTGNRITIHEGKPFYSETRFRPSTSAVGSGA